MACPNNHSPGAAVHSALSAGVLDRSVSFQCSRSLQAALYGQALTPTGSVNRGQVLKSNPPILTSIKGGGGGSPQSPQSTWEGAPVKRCNDWFHKEALQISKDVKCLQHIYILCIYLVAGGNGTWTPAAKKDGFQDEIFTTWGRGNFLQKDEWAGLLLFLTLDWRFWVWQAPNFSLKTHGEKSKLQNAAIDAVSKKCSCVSEAEECKKRSVKEKTSSINTLDDTEPKGMVRDFVKNVLICSLSSELNDKIETTLLSAWQIWNYIQHVASVAWQKGLNQTEQLFSQILLL